MFTPRTCASWKNSFSAASVLLCFLCFSMSVPAAVFAAGGYALSPDKALHMQNTVFVDIRPPEQFNALKIPQSVNIPLYAVKTKSFLKEKTVVFVPGHENARQMEKECHALRAQGWRVFYLSGGLPAWQKQGYAVDNDPSEQSHLESDKPVIYFTEKGLGRTKSRSLSSSGAGSCGKGCASCR